MHFTKEVIRNKPPSLEEGPMRCPTPNERCDFHRFAKRSIFQKCMQIIKLILYLEVIFFVAWLGRILISNYHLEYNKDITAYDPFTSNLHGDDFPVTAKSISSNDFMRSIKADDAISKTEQSEISTTPEMTSVFPNTEESYADNEWPLFEMYQGKNVLPNPSIDNANINIFDENTKSEKAKLGFPKLRITDDLENPSLILPNFGLIHVIEDRVYDSDIDSNTKSKLPFPLLEILGNNETTDKGNNKLEDNTSESSDTSESNDTSESSDTSELDLLMKFISNGVEKYSNSGKPAVTNATEGHDFNMKEILFQPEDLTAISKDLNSNDELVHVDTISTTEPLVQDEVSSRV